MDIQRLIFFIIFSFSSLLLWDAWQKEKSPPPAAATVPLKPAEAPAPSPGEQLAAAMAPAKATAIPAATGAAERSETISVKTDVLAAEIDSLGGDLKRIEFLKHRGREDKTKPFVLLEVGPNRTYVAQSGLVGEGMPNHKTRFVVAPGSRELAAGADKLEVRFTATGQGGTTVTKIYTFHRGTYVVDVGFEVKNTGASALRPFAYFQLVRDGIPPAGDSRMVPTYTGAAFFTEQEKFQKVEFSAIDKGKASVPAANADNGWIAMLQHYFVAAWLPQGKTPREFFVRKLSENLYAAGVIVPAGIIEPGKAGTVTVPLYAGPQEQDKLATLAPGLDLTVDYGWLTVIASPLFWVLAQIYKWVGNWGASIILLTVLIKLAFYPLSAASYRSMAKMKVMTPKLQRIKEQYGDDRQRLHQAMMELYKTEKINPLGGCLPIVVQIPVFIALYWVLLASVELRHAPFALWIADLSAPDPYYVLPIVMGITMVVQTRLNPTPPDPIQAKVMQIMPVAFSIFFFFFPAGLVLYWLVNNILSIAQQWQITRVMARAKTAHGRR